MSSSMPNNGGHDHDGDVDDFDTQSEFVRIPRLACHDRAGPSSSSHVLMRNADRSSGRCATHVSETQSCEGETSDGDAFSDDECDSDDACDLESDEAISADETPTKSDEEFLDDDENADSRLGQSDDDFLDDESDADHGHYDADDDSDVSE